MVAATLVWMVLPDVLRRGLAAALLPARPRPRGDRSQRLTRGLSGTLTSALTGAVARRRAAVQDRRRTPAPDPFATLQVQMRLGVLSGQLRDLEADDRAFARARRIKATEAAYDDLLAEACVLAGVDPAPDRFSRELELASSGWSW